MLLQIPAGLNLRAATHRTAHNITGGSSLGFKFPIFLFVDIFAYCIVP